MAIIECLLPAKNILVYDVAASASGALSVLNDFYNEVKEHEDKSIKWTFVVSKPHLEDTENIKIVRIPWVKKSWIHRLFCDHFIAPKLINKNNIDKVFSLQNVLVPLTNVTQILYLHQSLPFAEYRFKITENFHLWIYQNVISRLIFSGIKKAERTIVQANWMKVACKEKIGVNEDKIIVIPPVINIVPEKFFSYKNMPITMFIYPATPQVYKNHKIIIEACKLLIEDGIKDFQVIFTLTGKENKLSRQLRQQTEKYGLPIKFIGSIEREKLYDWYSKAILILPSYIESFPLPLLEAKINKAPILVSNSAFSHEILDGCENVKFFNPTKEIELKKIMLLFF